MTTMKIGFLLFLFVIASCSPILKISGTEPDQKQTEFHFGMKRLITTPCVQDDECSKNKRCGPRGHDAICKDGQCICHTKLDQKPKQFHVEEDLPPLRYCGVDQDCARYCPPGCSSMNCINGLCFSWKTDFFGEPIFAQVSQVSTRKLEDPFYYGGGLVHANKAANPGLIYDMGTNDYINYLCAVGYNTSAISQLVEQVTACPIYKPSILDVNLPSIIIPKLRKSVTLTRRGTNVGPVHSIYKPLIDPPPGSNVSVRTGTLVLNSTVMTISFAMAVSTSYQVNTGYFFGSLNWSDMGACRDKFHICENTDPKILY